MIPQVYRDVDILGCLERIVNQHTKEFKKDFEIDKKSFSNWHSLPTIPTITLYGCAVLSEHNV